ncbi:hypothetical protein [Streptomyces zingiberis]|uniref:Secreted protein n=1 Tax=Streptomyces zingiberis TaxID=2053010 RepID=A0ABX1C105_9ACTN|nr:hypothetical protein [Streptomyces zingiberis]NJQ03602.1 hypothetical protein [Streptomyces zingiberis]
MNDDTGAPPATSGPAPSRRARRWWPAGALAAVLAVLAGSFTYFNTNAFAGDRLCHGWISADEAREVLGGSPGRVSADEDSPWWCTVERTGWFPGSGDARLTVRAELKSADHPFGRDAWEMTGATHLAAGGAPGAYDATGGWTLLPASCAKEIEPAKAAGSATPVLSATVNSPSDPSDTADPAATARLLASAARSIAEGSRCGTGEGKESAGGPEPLYAPSAVARTNTAAACGLPGFRLGRVTGPRGEQLRQQTSGELTSPDADWFCDLSFRAAGPRGKDVTLARFAVVRDARLVAALGNRGFTSARCAGRETVFAFDDVSSLLEPEDREATGLPETAALADRYEAAAAKALECAT